MTHLDWGLLMIAAALILGGLASGPVWYAAGHRHGREDGSYGDGPKHRKGGPAPGFLLELPVAGRLPVDDGPAAAPNPPTVAGPPWAFFGGAQLDPQPGPDEYELLTVSRLGTPIRQLLPPRSEETRQQDALELRAVRADESDSAFTRRMALDMDRFIREEIVEPSNVIQHLIRERP